MIRHSAQVEWALHCAATLAALPEGRRLSAAAFAEMYEVPPKYLAKALQALAAAGLIASTPGPRGGYALAKPASAIRLIDIVDAVEGGEKLFRCQNIRRRGPCRNLEAKYFAKPCGLAAAMWKAESAWRRELQNITLASMTQEFANGAAPAVIRVLGAWIDEKATPA